MIKTKLNGFFSLIILAFASLSFAVFFGETTFSLKSLSFEPSLTTKIMLELRIPRALCAFVTGGLLSLAGLLMQAMFRNPLADPYILGVSGGAAVMVLLSSGLSVFSLAISGSAWMGSLIVIVLLFHIMKYFKNTQHESILLLGVAINSLCSAFISLMLVLNRTDDTHHLLFWLLGDLSYARLPIFEGFVLIMGTLASLMLARPLDLLALSDLKIKSLGVNIKTLRIQLFLISALLTASAVAMAGCIGFIGLIIPHILRLTFTNNHRKLIPYSVLAGGILLVSADTLARNILAPQILPVGIIMTFLGTPLLLYLLIKRHTRCLQ